MLYSPLSCEEKCSDEKSLLTSSLSPAASLASRYSSEDNTLGSTVSYCNDIQPLMPTLHQHEQHCDFLSATPAALSPLDELLPAPSYPTEPQRNQETNQPVRSADAQLEKPTVSHSELGKAKAAKKQVLIKMGSKKSADTESLDILQELAQFSSDNGAGTASTPSTPYHLSQTFNLDTRNPATTVNRQTIGYSKVTFSPFSLLQYVRKLYFF